MARAVRRAARGGLAGALRVGAVLAGAVLAGAVLAGAVRVGAVVAPAAGRAGPETRRGARGRGTVDRFAGARWAVRGVEGWGELWRDVVARPAGRGLAVAAERCAAGPFAAERCAAERLVAAAGVTAVGVISG